MDVAASEFYKEDKSYDLNFKEDVSSLFYCSTDSYHKDSHIHEA
jgi:enolase